MISTALDNLVNIGKLKREPGDQSEFDGLVRSGRTRLAWQVWLAHDLRMVFPEMRGFPSSNLKYMCAFARAWPDGESVQQAVKQLP